MNTKPQAKPTLDQRRANHAWHVVREMVAAHVKAGPDGKPVANETAKKFGGQAKKLPTRIMAAGLGQALAFLRAKDYAPQLLMAIADWVLDKRGNPASSKAKPTDSALLLEIVKGTSEFLRRATDETLAYLLWLNRFAEAEGLTQGE
jgi:CRISPR-associated protein Cmr5